MTARGVNEHEWDAVARLYRPLLAALARPLPARARVLDLGCGEGNLVAALINAGLDAWGCDLVLRDGETDRVRQIEEPYRLPFADSSFDLVCSYTVLEHVQDYDATMAEVARVLKPEGSSVHAFPGKFRLLESHFFVPFGGALQADSWLALWAFLGVRKSSQRGMSWREVANQNRRYLDEKTNYLTTRQLLSAGRRYFGEARFIEREYLELTRSEALLRWINRRTPLLARAYGELRFHVMLLATHQ